ncbi:hypothetical protein CVP05_05465 [Conservatibacter flavescens]|uniref:AMP nucleosidase n=1 Tax=Conservatibacter flavescens TaxID=28161 RepID=A0A2M8S379_9PAST|nr:LOG family protein [Conservatibacter flavescens]PJG85612.1 hypothetical protein CVP05_05465 [Conservatibacter flavescens]
MPDTAPFVARLKALNIDYLEANISEYMQNLKHFLALRDNHPDFAERKAKMLELADVCIALPGGPGTLEEISEVYSWARIGKNDSPCVFWNVGGFYEPIKAMFQTMVDNGFLTQDHFDKLLFTDNLTELERFIEAYQPMGIRTY